VNPDQQRRLKEFKELFARMPGRDNTKRMMATCMVTGLKPATIRQYRMEDPPRVPSEQVVKLMRMHLGVLGSGG